MNRKRVFSTRELAHELAGAWQSFVMRIVEEIAEREREREGEKSE